MTREAAGEVDAVMDAGPAQAAASPAGRLARLRCRVRDVSVGTRIVCVSLVVASIFAAVGVIGLVSSRDLAAQQDYQYRHNVVALSHMTQIRSAVSTQQEAVLAHILSDPGFYRDSAAAVITETDEAIDDRLGELEALGLARAERERLGSFQAMVRIWRTARDTALDASRGGDRQKAANIVLVRSEAIARAVKDRADAFVNQLVEAVGNGAKHAQASSEATVRLMLLLLLSGAVVAVTLSILAARAISRPLREAVDVLTGVGRGDFNRRFTVRRNDEVGQMGRSLNEALVVLQEAFARMRHRAFHDGLTGLANRALFQERLAHALYGAQRGTPVAVLLVDLDGFKQVNDAYGHAAGDALLAAVADRLRGAIRAGDTAARLGGDEFAILLDGTADPDAVAQRVLAEIQVPLTVGEVEIYPRASIGVAAWNGHTEVDAILHDADVAMYAAKTAGKGRVVTLAHLREHGSILAT